MIQCKLDVWPLNSLWDSWDLTSKGFSLESKCWTLAMAALILQLAWPIEHNMLGLWWQISEEWREKGGSLSVHLVHFRFWISFSRHLFERYRNLKPEFDPVDNSSSVCTQTSGWFRISNQILSTALWPSMQVFQVPSPRIASGAMNLDGRLLIDQGFNQFNLISSNLVGLIGRFIRRIENSLR